LSSETEPFLGNLESTGSQRSAHRKGGRGQLARSSSREGSSDASGVGALSPQKGEEGDHPGRSRRVAECAPRESLRTYCSFSRGFCVPGRSVGGLGMSIYVGSEVECGQS
jgi:hypothetical protein